MTFAVGPTMVVRRKFIDEAGGITSLKDYLAEDFELGRHIELGKGRQIRFEIRVEATQGLERRNL